MLFNSLDFALFFPIVVLIYFATPFRFRWLFLLAASYFFYACWKPGYLLLIVGSTLVDYWAGLAMGKFETKRERRPYLFASLAMNLGLLLAFKYFNFFSDSLQVLAEAAGLRAEMPYLNVLLPVGISFYTFQTLSYSIDVYRGERLPERHLGIFAVYVSFFPQLVAGPIERSTRLMPQFERIHNFDATRVLNGLTLMLWGFFKKIVVADRLATYVDATYNGPAEATGYQIILATYFFAIQIYCDFSGYSDIAIGSAQVMGFELMTNFRRPYYSKSIGEFWQRWHISLSTWFRDYLYIPLGGNRVARWRWYANLFVVFLVSGLWHGAAWTFVIWGGLHGLYIVVSAWTFKFRGRVIQSIGLDGQPHLLKLWRVFVTFHLVLLSWVFFRANSVQDVWVLLGRVFSVDLTELLHPLALLRSLDIGMDWHELAFGLGAIAMLQAIELLERKRPMPELLTIQPLPLRWAAYYCLILVILACGAFTSNQFIYFQF